MDRCQEIVEQVVQANNGVAALVTATNTGVAREGIDAGNPSQGTRKVKESCVADSAQAEDHPYGPWMIAQRNPRRKPTKFEGSKMPSKDRVAVKPSFMKQPNKSSNGSRFDILDDMHAEVNVKENPIQED